MDMDTPFPGTMPINSELLLLQDCWNTEEVWKSDIVSFESHPPEITDLKAYPRMCIDKELIETHIFTARHGNEALSSQEYDLEPDFLTQSARNMECPQTKFTPPPVKRDGSRPTQISPRLKVPVLCLTRLQTYPCSFCNTKFYSKLRQEAHENRAHAREKELLACEACSRFGVSMSDLSEHICTKLDRRLPAPASEKGNDFTDHPYYHANPVVSDNTEYDTGFPPVTPIIIPGNADKDNPTGTDPGPIKASRYEELVHKCTMCGKGFSLLVNLQHHMLNAKSAAHGGGIKSLKCPNCKLLFTTAAFQVHVQVCKFQKFTCRVCFRSFSSRSSLSRHKLSCTFVSSEEVQYKKQYPCKFCEKSFTRRDNLNAHGRVVHLNLKPKRLECDICKMTYSYYTDLRNHLKVKHNVEFTKCTFCHYIFREPQQLVEHVLKKHTKTKGMKGPGWLRTLNLQNDTFGGDSSLSRPEAGVAEWFSVGDRGLLDCPKCPMTFSSGPALRDHVQALHPSVGMAECQICGLFLTPPAILDLHQRLVHNIKVEKCGSCPREFSQPEQLRDHILRDHPSRTSLGGKWACSICENKFDFEGVLRIHEQIFHPEVFGRPVPAPAALAPLLPEQAAVFEPNISHRSLESPGSLSSHTKTAHQSRWRANCEICGRTFLSSDGLNGHKRAIHKMISKKCPICPYIFWSPETLADHIRQRHRNSGLPTDLEPWTYKCNTCSEHFSSLDNLSAHAMTHAVPKGSESFVKDPLALLVPSEEATPTHPVLRARLEPNNDLILPYGQSEADLRTHGLKLSRVVVKYNRPELEVSRHFESANDTAPTQRIVLITAKVMANPGTVISLNRTEIFTENFAKVLSFLECGTCKRIFRTELAAAGHRHERIWEPGDIRHDCDQCQVDFGSGSEVMVHMCEAIEIISWSTQRSDRYYECTQCLAEFLGYSDLVEHQCVL